MEQEYIVRVPRGETTKQFNVLHFNAALKVDIQTLKNCKMEREQSLKEIKAENADEERPEFGAGSEFGRKEREEARRRKYERRRKLHNNSPWILKIGGKHGKKYKGIREGGVTENTAYYVFFQAPDGAFEAFPVNEWYKFTPFQRYKALTAEEAEEKFTKRDQILNYFQVKHMVKKEGEGSTDEPKIKTERSIKKEFKVTDMDEWDRDSEDNLSENSDEEDVKPKIGKGKKIKKEKRKKDDSDNDDEEPGEDSDEGDNDDKEVDYMSDSSSSSESDTEKGDIKGVVDESALRGLVVSEDEDEEEENKEENNEQTEENKSNDEEKKVKPDDDSSGSDFDSDNPDANPVPKPSALLIQNRKDQKTVKSESALTTEVKPVIEGASADNSGGNNASGNQSNSLKFKHKLENPGPSSNKKQKVDKASRSSEPADGVTDEAVRRYLMRKPMTCTDLLQKFKNKVTQRDNLVQKIADTLKKLNPQTQKLNGKMYFFLKPT